MQRVLLVLVATTAAGVALAAPAAAAPEPFCVGGSNGTAKPIVCVQLPIRP